MAMLVVAVTSMLVSGVFLRQSTMARQVENEIAIGQAQCLLEGAVDWVRIILREDARTSVTDHLAEPWAVSLEQTRLDDESGDPTWISGAIEDAQSRYNLHNLVGPDGPQPNEVAVLRRLLEMMGANAALAEPIARRIFDAVSPRPDATGRPSIMPATLDDIVIDNADQRSALERLRPFVTLLPAPSAINANTAPAEVLAARFSNLSLVDARRLVEGRGSVSFRDLNDMANRLPGQQLTGGTGQVDVATQFFLLRGYVEHRRVRVQALALLKRVDDRVEVIWTREEAV
jgi:general secretion pathway protein K